MKFSPKFVMNKIEVVSKLNRINVEIYFETTIL